MIRAVTTLVGILFFATCSITVFAHTPEQAPHQKYDEGNLKLESGEVIENFSISYVTHGTLNANKTNAILMTSSIAGNHHRIDFLIGPGKALPRMPVGTVCPPHQATPKRSTAPSFRTSRF
jgi:homoserine O-acetyltransferase/O-succinyltransferase